MARVLWPTWVAVDREATSKPHSVYASSTDWDPKTTIAPGPGTERFFLGQRQSLGRQYIHSIPDVSTSDFLVFWGANPMVSHDLPKAPLTLPKKKKEPGTLIAVVDPRVTETARLADIHLRLRPGTDALLFKAMIKILLSEGLVAEAFLKAHTSGDNIIRSWFEDVDVEANCRVCRLDAEEVRKFARLFVTRKTAMRSDLGILMGRHSTLNSYLEMLLLALTGRFGAAGAMFLEDT